MTEEGAGVAEEGAGMTESEDEPRSDRGGGAPKSSDSYDAPTPYPQPAETTRCPTTMQRRKSRSLDWI